MFEEMEILSTLRHSNIVSFMTKCIEENTLWLIFELMDKGSLYDLLHVQKKSMSLKEIIMTSQQITEGMVFVHNMGIIHLDLKSKNILLGKNGIVKISDFGLAKIKQSNFTGTFGWMAPEVLRGESITKAADVYSFAVIVWEMLTGELPWKEFTQPQVIGLVGSKGDRLKIPSSCHLALRELLTLSFGDKRPTFEEIMKKLSTEFNQKFPTLIKDIPAKAREIVVDRMNLDRPNNWFYLAMEIWPLLSKDDIDIKLKGGKMEKVFDLWSNEGGKTENLIQYLLKLNRKDVLIELETKFPEINFAS